MVNLITIGRRQENEFDPDYLIKYFSRNFHFTFQPSLTSSRPVPSCNHPEIQRWWVVPPVLPMNISEVCWCQQQFSAYKERIPSVQEISRHFIRVENLGRVIAVVHRTESNSFFVSPAPWSAPGLSSLWLPAAAPTCGSLVLRTPRWRRAHQISHWNPSRRKTWWGSMEKTWSEMWWALNFQLCPTGMCHTKF